MYTCTLTEQFEGKNDRMVVMSLIDRLWYTRILYHVKQKQAWNQNYNQNYITYKQSFNYHRKDYSEGELVHLILIIRDIGTQAFLMTIFMPYFWSMLYKSIKKKEIVTWDVYMTKRNMFSCLHTIYPEYIIL